ncbi:LysR family transcriptional regulator [Actinosynnema sp. NPDC050436]|uniref:LysR family transcriptional regulator n=1 Tax=Actinosynnema sp. NPDC050436 TaxID=3155659 RepID=UPI00340B047E
MELEVRHLRYVDAIGTAGSLTRAAAALGLSQPALTAQLHRIEHAVGGALFDRGRHGARPTALGDVVLAHAREVLAALDDLHRAVGRLHDGPLLRVGVLPTALARLLGDVATAAVPDRVVDLSVVESRADALDALRDGGLDLALHVDFPGRECLAPAGVGMTPLGEEPVFVHVPTTHPAAGGPEPGLADLAGSTWLTAQHGDAEFDRHLADRCGPIAVQGAEELVVAQLLRRGADVVVPLQALDTGIALPGRTRAVAGSPLRLRHLLLWSADLDPDVVERVRAGLVDAYRRAAATRSRIPGWFDRNPGWLGSSEPA